MKKQCAHRYKMTGRVAETDHREDGQPEPDPRRRFRVRELAKCDKCDGVGARWSRFYGATERAALKRAGVPDPELPPPPGYKPKAEPTTAPLAKWPFPVDAGRDHFTRRPPWPKP